MARAAYELGRRRQAERLLALLRERAQRLTELDHAWQLHDFLSARRYEIEAQSEFSLETILFVLSDLVREGLLSLEEVEGLDATKRAKVGAMARF